MSTPGDPYLPPGCTQTMLDDALSGEPLVYREYLFIPNNVGDTMRRFGESESNYLKGSDLLQPNGTYAAVSVVIETVTVEAVGMEKNERYILYFRGKEKGMVLNNTTENFLNDTFGEPHDSTIEAVSAAFSGQFVQIFFHPTVMFGKKKVGGLRLRAVPATAAPAPRKRAAPAKQVQEPEPFVEEAAPMTDEEVPF